MREIERVIVSALIFSKDGKLLMGRKDPSKGESLLVLILASLGESS